MIELTNKRNEALFFVILKPLLASAGAVYFRWQVWGPHSLEIAFMMLAPELSEPYITAIDQQVFSRNFQIFSSRSVAKTVHLWSERCEVFIKFWKKKEAFELYLKTEKLRQNFCEKQKLFRKKIIWMRNDGEGVVVEEVNLYSWRILYIQEKRRTTKLRFQFSRLTLIDKAYQAY